jgi:TrmH family RNA methyltransferase
MSKKVVDIDSLSNPRIKRLKRMQRKPESGTWMIEGWKLFHEALLSGIQFLEIYVTHEALQDRAKTPLIVKAGCPVFALSQSLMKKVSSLETAPGVFAVGQSELQSADPAPERLGVCLLSIRDPGNFGTIVRSAEAAGCDKVAYTLGCVTPYHTRVVRASMGSVFRMPLVEIGDPGTALETLLKKGVCLYALAAGSAQSLFDVTPRAPSMVLIGSEAQGLPPNLPSSVSMVSIPMAGKVESLNAAMAAAVALYHFSRSLSR